MITRKLQKAIDAKIKLLRLTADELKRISNDIPAVNRNTNRILASIKMLEINISDCLDEDIVH